MRFTQTPVQREGWLLAGTILAAAMVFIDGTALNVALPAIQAGLGATAGDLLWFVNGYLLVLAALIPVGGAMGDRYGRRRIYMLGIGLFSLGSIFCGAAPNPELLIGARIFQGLGGALLVPGSLALLSAGTDPSRRGRAIGLWSAVTTAVTVLGPLLGGLLSDLGFWRAVFLINVPLGLAALLLLGTRVPKDAPSARSGFPDAGGSLLLALGLAALTWGTQSAPEQGFTAWVPWSAVVLGAAALAGFVVVEAKSAEPIIPLGLFRSSTFTGANLLTLFLYGALNVMGFFLTLNLVQVQGYPKVLAGMAMLPFVVCMVFLSRSLGTWADRIGPRPFLTAGPLVVACGFVLLAFTGLTPGWQAYAWTYLPGIVVFGLGMSITVAPLSAAVMGSVADEFSGTASGVNNAVSRVGGVLALAILGAVAVTLFPGAWTRETASLPLSPEDRHFLAQEAVRMAGASLPPGLSSDLALSVHRALVQAFLGVWRVVMLSCAVLALVAGASGWFYVREVPRSKAPNQESTASANTPDVTAPSSKKE
jgi:EmrB/QacA subfamily drug resistance transporter